MLTIFQTFNRYLFQNQTNLNYCLSQSKIVWAFKKVQISEGTQGKMTDEMEEQRGFFFLPRCLANTCITRCGFQQWPHLFALCHFCSYFKELFGIALSYTFPHSYLSTDTSFMDGCYCHLLVLHLQGGLVI